MLWNILGLDPSDIIMDGPYFQTRTQERQGCQVDYLIQTRFHSLYLFEIKFSKKQLGMNVIEEVEKKLKALRIPKYCSIRPILIHVNGVDENVLDTRYFDKTIDFGQLLETT